MSIRREDVYISHSQAFPAQPDSDDESASFEDNILFKVNSEPDETEYARLKLERVFKRLKPDEIELLQLSVRMKYKDIIKLQKFSKYKTIDSLKHKVYDIMKKIRKNKSR